MHNCNLFAQQNISSHPAAHCVPSKPLQDPPNSPEQGFFLNRGSCQGGQKKGETLLSEQRPTCTMVNFTQLLTFKYRYKINKNYSASVYHKQTFQSNSFINSASNININIMLPKKKCGSAKRTRIYTFSFKYSWVLKKKKKALFYWWLNYAAHEISLEKNSYQLKWITDGNTTKNNFQPYFRSAF